MPPGEKRRIVCSICQGHAGHLFRHGRDWAHWVCKLGPMTLDERQAFLGTLHTLALKHAPGLILTELGVINLVIDLLRERGDAEGLYWPPQRGKA